MNVNKHPVPQMLTKFPVRSKTEIFEMLGADQAAAGTWIADVEGIDSGGNQLFRCLDGHVRLHI